MLFFWAALFSPRSACSWRFQPKCLCNSELKASAVLRELRNLKLLSVTQWDVPVCTFFSINPQFPAARGYTANVSPSRRERHGSRASPRHPAVPHGDQDASPRSWAHSITLDISLQPRGGGGARLLLLSGRKIITPWPNNSASACLSAAAI